MSGTAVVIVVVVVVVVLALLALVVVNQTRSRRLRQRFGPEYDRAVQDGGDRRTAERELADREKRHKQLELTPLSAEAHQHYTQQWALIQEQFVDHPDAAVSEADRLITQVMTDRGYPTGDVDERAAHLSVEHAGTVQDYREAHQLVQGGGADTEGLRRAMLKFRSLFGELVNAGGPGRAEQPGEAERA